MIITGELCCQYAADGTCVFDASDVRYARRDHRSLPALYPTVCPRMANHLGQP